MFDYKYNPLMVIKTQSNIKTLTLYINLEY